MLSLRWCVLSEHWKPRNSAYHAKAQGTFKTVALVRRLNNSLPIFPNGREADKFTLQEILEILEWSIPEARRTKFDLNGYVPTEFTWERFMTKCEAMNDMSQKLPLKAIIQLIVGKP
jgi:hypothetical protein